MAGIAQLARAQGHEVSGCDSNVFPPMSTLLASENIPVLEGYLAEHLEGDIDQIVVGNALSRGNPLVESMLNDGRAFLSGPQWLHENFLRDKKVIAVSGTHGKTSTSSMVAWVLHRCHRKPGYLIGGKPGNFDHSASAGDSRWFVIEADEYDTAFFDKRSKFIHYKPDIAILNNLEFDHADIFENIGQIKTQFHHLLRIVPAKGFVVANYDDENISSVLEMGCWSQVESFSIDYPGCRWFARPLRSDHSEFEICLEGKTAGSVHWDCIGRHNMHNALAAMAASHCAGIGIEPACRALDSFKPSDRRLQRLFHWKSLYLYEDFAHHPTAIGATIDAVLSRHPDHEIIVVLEPGSNTMKRGVHGNRLGESLNQADRTFIYDAGGLDWDPNELPTRSKIAVRGDKHALLDELILRAGPNVVIICMSNASFDGIPYALRERLETKFI